MSRVQSINSYYWFNYYLNLIEERTPELVKSYASVYLNAKILSNEFSDEDFELLVNAIKKDMVTEGCCIGPEFYDTYNKIMGNEGLADVYRDFFQEAAVRDVLVECNIYPCSNCLQCNKM